MTSLLTLRAGPAALAHLRAHGSLRGDQIDIVPGASGGAKWIGIGGLDRYLFGHLLPQPRTRPLHLIGSSIGSWRMACLAQRDPVAALARGHEAYIYRQRYSPKPGAPEVSEVLMRALDDLLGPEGVHEILSHPTFRVHVITAQSRGLASSQRRPVLATAMALAAAANVVTRRSLAWQMTRTIFHSAGNDSPFLHLRDLPTVHRTLTPENLRAALLASGSIPLLMEGVRIPGAPGLHWDGGVTDYHLDLDYGPGPGLVLYAHFYDHVVPGWFDKSLPWRRAGAVNFSRTLLIAPSPAFVASLPGTRIPDRRDFFECTEAERMTRWQAILDASTALGDELHELIETGRLVDAIIPWA
ncbi:patatin-like phospholipase family protein [Gemmatimonas sp.]|uniref:patatin-like phospholipase family protein n=1 Tax=Gemmatimonas sp. TaxID=1962908 RepID=UPI00286AA278|nr:patatin-like phospholipase family protein [Gemmatimonas sp.]